MNGLKTAVLLATLGALLVAIGGLWAGQNGAMLAFVAALVMNGISYWFSDRIVLRMHHATEVGQDHPLYRITHRLAQKAGLPMPKVYIIPNPSPNAFATGRDPQHAAVAATEGLLRLLPESELEGVIAHELAHVKHRDILLSTIAASIGSAIMLLVQWAHFAAMFGGGGGRNDERGGNPIALIATILLAPLAAGLIQAAISRSREFEADRGGAEIAGTPMGLANALRKLDAAARQIPMHSSPATAHMYIVKPFLGGLSSMFSTHPPTEARINALMALRMGRV